MGGFPLPFRCSQLRTRQPRGSWLPTMQDDRVCVEVGREWLSLHLTLLRGRAGKCDSQEENIKGDAHSPLKVMPASPSYQCSPPNREPNRPFSLPPQPHGAGQGEKRHLPPLSSLTAALAAGCPQGTVTGTVSKVLSSLSSVSIRRRACSSSFLPLRP